MKFKTLGLINKLKQALMQVVVPCIVLTCAPVYSEAEPADPRPLKKPESQKVRLVDHSLYCYAGWGMNDTTFQFDNQLVYAKDRSSPIIPDIGVVKNPKLDFGCSKENITFEFFLVDDAFEFQEEVTVDNALYNAIDYEQSALVIGYTIAVIPHMFYLNFGFGYTHINYTLGLYGEKYSNEYSSNEEYDENTLVYVNLMMFVNHFFFVSYQTMQTQQLGSVFHVNSQLTLNFYRRF